MEALETTEAEMVMTLVLSALERHLSPFQFGLEKKWTAALALDQNATYFMPYFTRLDSKGQDKFPMYCI